MTATPALPPAASLSVTCWCSEGQWPPPSHGGPPEWDPGPAAGGATQKFHSAARRGVTGKRRFLWQKPPGTEDRPAAEHKREPFVKKKWASLLNWQPKRLVSLSAHRLRGCSYFLNDGCAQHTTQPWASAWAPHTFGFPTGKWHLCMEPAPRIAWAPAAYSWQGLLFPPAILSCSALGSVTRAAAVLACGSRTSIECKSTWARFFSSGHENLGTLQENSCCVASY